MRQSGGWLTDCFACSVLVVAVACSWLLLLLTWVGVYAVSEGVCMHLKAP
jgi:hypothetical protein